MNQLAREWQTYEIVRQRRLPPAWNGAVVVVAALLLAALPSGAFADPVVQQILLAIS